MTRSTSENFESRHAKALACTLTYSLLPHTFYLILSVKIAA